MGWDYKFALGMVAGAVAAFAVMVGLVLLGAIPPGLLPGTPGQMLCDERGFSGACLANWLVAAGTFCAALVGMGSLLQLRREHLIQRQAEWDDREGRFAMEADQHLNRILYCCDSIDRVCVHRIEVPANHFLELQRPVQSIATLDRDRILAANRARADAISRAADELDVYIRFNALAAPRAQSGEGVSLDEAQETVTEVRRDTEVMRDMLTTFQNTRPK